MLLSSDYESGVTRLMKAKSMALKFHGHGLQLHVWKGVFRLLGNQASGHAMRLNSWTSTEGLPVSSINCDRLLHSGIRAPEL